MALQDLQIDDRTFDQLVAVLHKQLPVEYTDRNPSDAVVTLMELFCWLGEMALYRMNRVPESHRDEFLDLLVDPPNPVTVPVTFTVTYGVGGAHAVTIPAGTRVATDFVGGSRSVFESMNTVEIPDTTNTATIRMREYLEVTDEVLGAVDGTKNQALALSPVHSEHGLVPGATAPVLADYVNRSADYDPNPRVRTMRGMFSGVGPPAAGIVAAEFDGGTRDAHYFLTYAPPDFTLTRGDGATETVAVAGAAIPAGETERVEFPSFAATVVIDDTFDKLAAIGLAADGESVVGTGAVDPTSVAIVATSGVVEGISATAVTITGSGDPANLALALPTGFSGVLDGSGPAGVRRVQLTDGADSTLTIELDVTTPFDGNETGTIDLGSLANLVVLGGEHWTAYHSLQTERSKRSVSNPALHVQVDPLARVIRFGDDEFGAVPPAGARVVCSRYQLLRGPAGLIEEGEIQHLLTPIPLDPGDSVVVTNADDASGGEFFFSAEERLARGLEEYRNPYRLVTSDDFERVLRDDFNDYQELAGRSERIARAAAVMNSEPSWTALGVYELVEAVGNVTVLVLRELSAAEQAIWEDLSVPVAAKQALLGLQNDDPLDPLRRKVRRFLNERRLITTQVQAVAPVLRAVELAVSFWIDAHRNVTEMEGTVRAKIQGLLDLLEGGFDGRGWPRGRDVFRSEIYRLVEELEGVDYVESLVLGSANSFGDVEIEPHELPVLSVLSVSPLRA